MDNGWGIGGTRTSLRSMFASTTLIAAGVFVLLRAKEFEALFERLADYLPALLVYTLFAAGVGVLVGRGKWGAVFGAGVFAIILTSDLYWPLYSVTDALARNLVGIALVGLVFWLAVWIKRQAGAARTSVSSR